MTMCINKLSSCVILLKSQAEGEGIKATFLLWTTNGLVGFYFTCWRQLIVQSCAAFSMYSFSWVFCGYLSRWCRSRLCYHPMSGHFVHFFVGYHLGGLVVIWHKYFFLNLPDYRNELEAVCLASQLHFLYPHLKLLRDCSFGTLSEHRTNVLNKLFLISTNMWQSSFL